MNDGIRPHELITKIKAQIIFIGSAPHSHFVLQDYHLGPTLTVECCLLCVILYYPERDRHNIATSPAL